MIFRKYGQRVHSVVPNFDPRAMNEIGFTKDGSMELGWDEFDAAYERISRHDLVAEAEGDVQHDAEQGVLNSLRAQIERLEAGAVANAVLLVESEMGKDYPKLREKVSKIVVGHENRLHFQRSVDPPLRIGVYAPRES